MRIVQINAVHVGSTGKIMRGIVDIACTSGVQCLSCSPRFYQRGSRAEFPAYPNHFYFGTPVENMLHLRMFQMTGFHGCFSAFGTYQLLHELERIKPDIVHLHNLHNCTVNLPMLFWYLKKKKIKTVWTLHDCWAFTGQCPHFIISRCNKWKVGCHHCPQILEYPKSFVDNTKRMYSLKKKWFTGFESMTLVTPSRWLADLVEESMKEYPIRVINNGIDFSMFSSRESVFRGVHRIPAGKPIVLGVAFGWGYSKGLDVFLKLAERLGETYQIVLVGTDDAIDLKLPKNIISIHRTYNQKELAEIYSTADVFVNPTREDNFPTVNIEALACGTPVITFNTGGSPEILDETCGVVIQCDDVDAMEKAICYVCEERPFSKDACLKRAAQYDMRDKFTEYVDLYQELMKR